MKKYIQKYINSWNFLQTLLHEPYYEIIQNNLQETF